jgi:hypothetical protein
LEDIEGKTAREQAIESLELEQSKLQTGGGTQQSELKLKTKIADLTKIIKLLPDEDKEGEMVEDDDEDHITPGKRKPAA